MQTGVRSVSFVQCSFVIFLGVIDFTVICVSVVNSWNIETRSPGIGVG
jgi:hypothetical protein